MIITKIRERLNGSEWPAQRRNENERLNGENEQCAARQLIRCSPGTHTPVPTASG